MTVTKLSELRHDVTDFRGTLKEGISDDQIWEIVNAEKRLLITTDRGFLQHRRERHWGIIVVLLRKPNKFRIHESIMQVISGFREEEWPGLSVAVRDRVRSVWKA